MAHQSNFQRSSPLRTPVRLSKLKSQHKLKKSTDVPPLATQLLRSLNNDRRGSFAARVTIGRTVRQDICLLDGSCMDQFDDSFVLRADPTQPLTPRKSPHMRRRNSLTRFGRKLLKPSSSSSSSSNGTELSGTVSRKSISSMRKRLMNSVRKVLPRMARRTDYSRL